MTIVTHLDFKNRVCLGIFIAVPDALWCLFWYCIESKRPEHSKNRGNCLLCLMSEMTIMTQTCSEHNSVCYKQTGNNHITDSYSKWEQVKNAIVYSTLKIYLSS